MTCYRDVSDLMDKAEWTFVANSIQGLGASTWESPCFLSSMEAGFPPWEAQGFHSVTNMTSVTLPGTEAWTGHWRGCTSWVKWGHREPRFRREAATWGLAYTLCFTGSHLRVRARSVTQVCPTLCDPMDCSRARLLCPWDFPGKHARADCHLLLLPTQGSTTHLLHWQTDPLPLRYQGSPSLGPASYIRFPNNSVLFQDPKVMSFQSQGWGEVTKVRLLRTLRCRRIYLGAAPFDLKASEAEMSHLPFGYKHTAMRQA